MSSKEFFRIRGSKMERDEKSFNFRSIKTGFKNITNRTKYSLGFRNDLYSAHRARAEEAEKEMEQANKVYDDVLKKYIPNPNRVDKLSKEDAEKTDQAAVSLAKVCAKTARAWLSAKHLNKAIDIYSEAASLYYNASANFDLDKKEQKDYLNSSSRVNGYIDRLEKVKRGTWHGLEGKTSTAALIIGIIGGIFFLTPNFTGNAISDLNQTSTNFIGIGFFILALIAAFFYSKRKN
jgi:hypothetical protein